MVHGGEHVGILFQTHKGNLRNANLGLRKLGCAYGAFLRLPRVILRQQLNLLMGGFQVRVILAHAGAVR